MKIYHVNYNKVKFKNNLHKSKFISIIDDIIIFDL